MAFEYTTLDEIRKLAEKITATNVELINIQTRIVPQIRDDITLDRILITEIAKHSLKLSTHVAELATILAGFLVSEAQLRASEEDEAGDPTQ